MAGTGRVQVVSKTPIGYNQYDVTISFDIAFDWGGWNSGAYYTIYCNGQSSSGNASFSISSGGGSWVWGHIASHTFRITMPTSGKSLPISFSAGINTGVNPSYIDAYGSDTLPARTWQWKVSYNANGGTGAPGSQTKNINVDLKLSTIKPTRTGYTFLGWSTSKTASSASYSPGATYSSNAALTLYAVWKINTWTVKYDANGGTGAPSSQTKTYGQTLKLSTTKPTKKDYNFLGWGTSTESTTIEYEAGADYTNNTAITLYAIWELAYIPPRITTARVDRCTDKGILADDGICIKVFFEWTSDYPLKTFEISYKKNNSTNWNMEVGGIYRPEPIYSGSYERIYGSSNEPFDIESDYDIKITVRDTNGSTTITRRLPPISFAIDFLKGGKGVAFGRPASLEDTFEVDFDAKFDRSIVDKFGEEIQNGLAPNISTAIEDPNTTLKQLIVTNKNTPMGTGQYMYIETRFFDTKSLTANRSQTAYPYSVEGSSYHRFYYGGSWSPWRRGVNGDEPSIRAITVSRANGGDASVSTAGRIYLSKVISDSSDGKLSSNGIGVVIGAGVKKVIVSMNVFAFLNTGGYGWYRFGIIRAGDPPESYTGFGDGIAEAANNYTSIVLTDRMIDVNQGDTICLLKVGTETNTIRGNDTWMTVKIAQ